MFSVPKEDCVGAEEYYYVNDAQPNFCFNVILAGTTSPSKDYFIHHPKSKIWVFEYVLSGKGHIVTENETFEVIAVLDGTVINIKDDELLGKIVEVQHENNLVSSYQSLGEVSVKKNDFIYFPPLF